MNRQHQTKAGPDRLSFQSINASIIQGLEIGPVAYIFNVSDLHTISPSNILLKYADDTYLLIPAANSTSVPCKLHIKKQKQH